ncbi:MAG: shikimate kinase [Candidatus Izemoplasmatales bacterium]|jgi:shikimate dehydrogenase|nr:shikimate kinase [Candidatus Izemoplasmatales bacterium]
MFGLLGKNLSHSFSKDIHNAFGNKNYELYNIDNLETFLKSNHLSGFNVTIPYKSEIVKYIDILDPVAEATNSVNTVVVKGKKLFGYNTDYYGFIETLKYNNINVENKDVIILGNGSVSNTVVLALETLKVRKVVRLCRNKKTTIDDYFDNYKEYMNYQIIINTTPVGMYPNNDDKLLFELNSFKSLEVAVDLIYNPLRTKFLIEAEKNNIKAINGLYMLVMQAKKAHELFFNSDIPLNVSNKVYKKLLKKMYNIVFVGLPLSGKSKYSKLLESLLNKKLYDTDIEVENVINMSIFDYFQIYSEAEFRMFESEIVRLVYKKHNHIVSTGGGTVKVWENIERLKQNGIIIYLNKDPLKIAEKKIRGRPLIKKNEDILLLAEERIPLYKKACDILIDINYDTVYHINEIKEKIDAYLNR